MAAELDESTSARHDRIRLVSATLLKDCFIQFRRGNMGICEQLEGRADRVRSGGGDGPNHGYEEETFYKFRVCKSVHHHTFN